MAVNPNFSDRAKEDYRLVTLALEHDDQQAYAVIMKRYRDSVHFVLMKMVHNTEDAEDLTIECFSKAFKNLQKYDLWVRILFVYLCLFVAFVHESAYL